MKEKYYNNENSRNMAVEFLNNAINATKTLFSQSITEKLIIQFNDDLLNNLSDQGKLAGGTCTPSKNLQKIRLEFDPNYIAWRIEEYGLEKTKTYVIKTVRHEFFHAYQFLWIIKHGGQKAINNYFIYKKMISYEQNILEQGAHDFEDPNNYKIQNLNNDLKFLLK